MHSDSLTAAFGGQSSASRRARAALQWRDRFGRWVEMGRGVNFSFRDSGGSTHSVNGKFIGASDTKGRGYVHVKDDPNLPNGIYEIDSSNGEKVMATLDAGYLEKQGIDSKKSQSKASTAAERADSDIPTADELAAARLDLPVGWERLEDPTPDLLESLQAAKVSPIEKNKSSITEDRQFSAYERKDGKYLVREEGVPRSGRIFNSMPEALAALDAVDKGESEWKPTAKTPKTPATEAKESRIAAPTSMDELLDNIAAGKEGGAEILSGNKSDEDMLALLTARPNQGDTVTRPREVQPPELSEESKRELDPMYVSRGLILDDITAQFPDAQARPNGDLVTKTRTRNGRRYDTFVRRTENERFQVYMQETIPNGNVSRVIPVGSESHSATAVNSNLRVANAKIDSERIGFTFNRTKTARAFDDPDGTTQTAPDQGSRPTHIPFGGGEPLQAGDIVEWTDNLPYLTDSEGQMEPNPTFGRVFRGEVKQLRPVDSGHKGKNRNADYEYSDSVYAVFPEYNKEKGAKKPNSQQRSRVSSNLRRVDDPSQPLGELFQPKVTERDSQSSPNALSFGVPGDGTATTPRAPLNATPGEAPTSQEVTSAIPTPVSDVAPGDTITGKDGPLKVSDISEGPNGSLLISAVDSEGKASALPVPTAATVQKQGAPDRGRPAENLSERIEDWVPTARRGGSSLYATARIEGDDGETLIVRKPSSNESLIRETLALDVLSAMGVTGTENRAPKGSGTVAQDAINATPASFTPAGRKSIREDKNALLTGLFDYIAGNEGRTDFSYVIDENGTLVPIDQSGVKFNKAPKVSSRLAAVALGSRNEKSVVPRKGGIQFTVAELETVRDNLESLMELFSSNKKSSWYNSMMRRLDSIIKLVGKD